MLQTVVLIILLMNCISFADDSVFNSTTSWCLKQVIRMIFMLHLTRFKIYVSPTNGTHLNLQFIIILHVKGTKS